MRTERDYVINKDVHAVMDSMVRQTIEEQTNRLISSLHSEETVIVLFDTDKPVADTTGMPPIKAIVWNTAKQEEQVEESTQKHIQGEQEVHEKHEDKSIVEQNETSEIEQKESWWDALTRYVMDMLMIPVMFVALWIVYKLYNLIKT